MQSWAWVWGLFSCLCSQRADLLWSWSFRPTLKPLLPGPWRGPNIVFIWPCVFVKPAEVRYWTTVKSNCLFPSETNSITRCWVAAEQCRIGLWGSWAGVCLVWVWAGRFMWVTVTFMSNYCWLSLFKTKPNQTKPTKSLISLKQYMYMVTNHIGFREKLDNITRFITKNKCPPPR